MDEQLRKSIILFNLTITVDRKDIADNNKLEKNHY